MNAVLGLIPSWAWRWIAIVVLAAATGWAFYLKGEERVQVDFDEYKAQVRAAGNKQNELTRQSIAAHKQLKEIADGKARTAAAARDAALARVRSLESGADRRLVPTAPPRAAGGDRICFAREELDRGLRDAFARLSQRALANAEEGQRGVDVAALCRDWAAKR
jgi:hypothetical protein